MGIFLFIIAFILVLLFSPIGFIFIFIKAIVSFNFKYLDKFYFSLALSLDQFGNVVMAGLFNTIMITKSSKNLFGNIDETISSVVGKNEIDNTLTKFGKLLNYILNRIEKDHSKNAIENDEKIKNR